MAKIRHWMRIETHPVPNTKSFSFRAVTAADAQILAPLMELSYRGTIDDAGESLEQCLEEMKSSLSGKYGPFLYEASFLVEENHQAVSASLVSLHENRPVLIYAMTLPERQGQGLGRFLLQRSIDALSLSSHSELFLAVTKGNEPAQKLYTQLGFKIQSTSQSD